MLEIFHNYLVISSDHVCNKCYMLTYPLNTFNNLYWNIIFKIWSDLD